MGDVLVLNTGSSSIKFARFGAAPVSGSVTEIGGAAALDGSPVAAPDHAAALDVILTSLGGLEGVAAVAHRVVHGGTIFDGPAMIDAGVEAQIEALADLAPLHNPVALRAIRAMRALAPELVQVAAFDTAFHRTIPDVFARYAVPDPGLRRYGFHGLSYASLVRALPELSGVALPRRLLACHLGNGASLCAILEGQSRATTMGYSPVSGLTMGTRSGEIDANAVLDLAERDGIAATRALLNKGSGLLGLGGRSDMRALHAADTEASRFALDHFAHQVVLQSGAMIAAMGGIEAIAFTGGIGENDAAMRAEICTGLGWAGLSLDAEANAAHCTAIAVPGSTVSAWIVPAAEEAEIARQAALVMAQS